MNLGGEGLGEVVKDLMTQVSCSGCGERFHAPDIKVIGHEDNVWFLKASCRNCHIVNLTVAFIGGETVTKKPRRVSDLDKSEKRKPKRCPALTGNDLLDMHRFLKDFDGDFDRLFGMESAGRS